MSPVPGAGPENPNPISASIPRRQAHIAEQSSPDLNSPVTVSVTPGQQPAAIAQEIVATTMAGNFNRLNDLFVAMRTSRSPAVRIWRHLAGRCMGALDASTLRYEAVPANPTLIARVDIYQGQRYVGEIKMRLIGSEWFTVFVTYPSITGCS
jgi:hypothetical protein